MISSDAVQEIADGWVDEFSVDPYVLRERGMDAWFKMNELVYDHPSDAVLVFEKVAEKDLINWTFEGFAAGPIRTFLMLHGNSYEGQLTALRHRVSAFNEMHALAVEGL